jgi:hypothetical protein
MCYKGYKHTPESIAKQKLAHTGNSYNTGKPLSEERKRKISQAHKGKKLLEETKRKIGLYGVGKTPTNKGVPRSKEFKEFIRKVNSGSNSYHWKGGITPINMAVRGSDMYKKWRQDVFVRDGFTCQMCGDNSGGNLNAHHIKSVSVLLEEAKNYLPLMSKLESMITYSPLWNIENGVTLCKKCHIEIHKRSKNVKH